MAVPPQSVAKVLWRARQTAGTARPHLLRKSGARKSVVAVTGNGYIARGSGSYLCRGHNRQRPLLYNTQRNVYLATQTIPFESKSSLTL
jgi:hypothetical protein